MNTTKLVVGVIVIVLLVLYNRRKWVWRVFMKRVNRYHLKQGIYQLCEAYDGQQLSLDEMKMLMVIEEILSERIPTFTTDCDVQGSFLADDLGPVFLMPAEKLLIDDLQGKQEIMPVYLAGEAADFVSMSEGVLDELTAIIMRHEWMIKVFIHLSDRGHDFGEECEMITDLTEQAWLYQEDKDGWLLRIRAKIFHQIPDLVPAANA